MVWSQFPLKIFGAHFGNSVLDNSNWDKLNHSLTKKSHTCEEGEAHLRISFWHLLMNFENSKNQTFEKMKKIAGDIIILHKCTKNHDHLLYFSRDMAHEECNCYFHFGLSGFFTSTFLQPINGRKNSILNGVIKLNFIKCRMKFYSSKKNCCRCRQTMCRLCFCSQRECRK